MPDKSQVSQIALIAEPSLTFGCDSSGIKNACGMGISMNNIKREEA